MSRSTVSSCFAQVLGFPPSLRLNNAPLQVQTMFCWPSFQGRTPGGFYLLAAATSAAVSAVRPWGAGEQLGVRCAGGSRVCPSAGLWGADLAARISRSSLGHSSVAEGENRPLKRSVLTEEAESRRAEAQPTEPRGCGHCGLACEGPVQGRL